MLAYVPFDKVATIERRLEWSCARMTPQKNTCLFWVDWAWMQLRPPWERKVCAWKPPARASRPADRPSEDDPVAGRCPMPPQKYSATAQICHTPGQLIACWTTKTTDRSRRPGKGRTTRSIHASATCRSWTTTQLRHAPAVVAAPRDLPAKLHVHPGPDPAQQNLPKPPHVVSKRPPHRTCPPGQSYD